jgi:CheY-like chemotaxis protein
MLIALMNNSPTTNMAAEVDRVTATRFNVLVADDSDNDQILTGRLIAKSSCLRLVATVNSGQMVKDYLTGRDKFADRNRFPFPDLVLLDMDLGAISGLEVLDWIKKSCFSKLRVVMLSGTVDPEIAVRAILGGADYFQSKNSSSAEFAHLIRRLEVLLMLLEKREPQKKVPRMNNILTVVDGRAPPLEESIIAAASTGRNFILILDAESELEKLWSALGTTNIVPDRLQRWALLALTEALTSDDFAMLQQCCQERFVYLIEQITLNRNVPPRTKRYMLYCEIRGIISDHDTVEEAGLGLLNYLQGFKMARLLPLAGIYDHGHGRWERVKKLSSN